MTIEAMKAFCKERMPNRDWEHGDLVIYDGDVMKSVLSLWHKVPNIGVRDCEIIYSPDEPKYQYLLTSTVVYDMRFQTADVAVRKIITDLQYGLTYLEDMGIPAREDRIRYYIGDLFILHEQGGDSYPADAKHYEDIDSQKIGVSTAMIPVRMERVRPEGIELTFFNFDDDVAECRRRREEIEYQEYMEYMREKERAYNG